MQINGLEGKSVTQLELELNRGGKFVVYLWVVSILIYTWKRPSAIYYIHRVAIGFRQVCCIARSAFF